VCAARPIPAAGRRGPAPTEEAALAVDPTAPVTEIEGIGPSAAAGLRLINVHAAFDLLRCAVDEIHAAVHTIASRAEAERWRAMAALLQVAEVTPQWAEGLVAGGILAVSDLAGASLPEVEALLRDARARGVIPSVPTTAQVADMLRDAAILAHTGSLTGTVLGAAGAPIAGAAVSLGARRQQTDARGRFRLLRLPLGRALPLLVEHPEYEPLVVERPPLALDLDVVGVRVLRPRPRAADAAPRPRSRLSELDGDVLPVPNGHRVRETMTPVADLRDGDVFLVHELYRSAPDAKLVSRFKDYEDGVFLVRTARVALALLPTGVGPGQHVRLSGGDFSSVEMDARALGKERARLRMRRRFADRPLPTTDDERRAEIRERVAFLQAEGYFGGPTGGAR
jgi:hypothetical protein